MPTSKSEACIAYYESKFGRITLLASDKGLIKVSLSLNKYEEFKSSLTQHYNITTKNNQILDQACKELDEFFSYKRKKFDVPFDIQEGTDFQRSVWHQLTKVPYGKTCSYKDIAVRINNPGAVRAIGLANKANPLPLFIPCHRVIGANGALVGYAGNDPKNLEFKAKLLQFEKNKNGLLSMLS